MMANLNRQSSKNELLLMIIYVIIFVIVGYAFLKLYWFPKQLHH